jgi:hypothetical protein
MRSPPKVLKKIQTLNAKPSSQAAPTGESQLTETEAHTDPPPLVFSPLPAPPPHLPPPQSIGKNLEKISCLENSNLSLSS